MTGKAAHRKWPSRSYEDLYQETRNGGRFTVEGISVGNVGHCTPTVTMTGPWLCIVPPDLWATTPKLVRLALSALMKEGYCSVPEIAATPDHRLLDADNIGEGRLAALREWIDEVMPAASSKSPAGATRGEMMVSRIQSDQSSSMKTLRGVVEWLAEAPAGTTLSACALLEVLTPFVDAAPAPHSVDPPEPGVTWRERLWTAPPQTRIGVQELMEALGRPRSWIYRHTSPKAAKEAGHDLLPYRKLEGELVFLVGEIRTWIIEQEDIMRRGRMESTAAERAGEAWVASHRGYERDKLLSAIERKDWPQAIAYALQGRAQDFRGLGPAELAIALVPGVGRRAFQEIVEKSGDKKADRTPCSLGALRGAHTLHFADGRKVTTQE